MQFRVLILITLGLAVGACASTSTEQSYYMMPDYSDRGTTNPHVMAVDEMHFRKPMPYRPSDRSPADFYFKRCSELGDEVYYSKTSYECSGL